MVIRKIGKKNSIFLPSIVLKELGLEEDDEIIIYTKDNEIRIRSLYQ